ncbi:hypothetical protein V8F20_007080 [Naviculisporaceae sp. PSN 640]
MSQSQTIDWAKRPPPDPARAAESNATLFLSIICVFSSLSLVTASLRFYSRAVLVRSFGKDDVFMVLAVLCAIGGLASWCITTKVGYGRHTDTISRAEYLVLLETQFVQSVVEASFAFGFLKISIALSLLRFGRSRWYRITLWCLIGFTCIYTLFALSTFLTFCQPISAQWDRSKPFKCYNRELYRDFGLFNAACNIFTDVAFATLPIPLIWSLQLQRRIRIYLIAILSGGYFAVALGVAKAVFIIAFVHERDGTFYPWAPFFGSLQLDIGIIAACAPTLRPLLGSVLRLTTHLNHDREANYYRAGKALDRIPRTGHGSGSGPGNTSAGRNTGRRGSLLKPNKLSGEFAELVKSRSLGAKSQNSGQAGHHQKWTMMGGIMNPLSDHRRPVLNGMGPTTMEIHHIIREKEGDDDADMIMVEMDESTSDELGMRPPRHPHPVHSRVADDYYSPPDFSKGIIKTTEFRVEKSK